MLLLTACSIRIIIIFFLYLVSLATVHIQKYVSSVTDACDAGRPIFVPAPYDLFTKGPLQRNVSGLTLVYVLYDLCLVLTRGSGLRMILSG